MTTTELVQAISEALTHAQDPARRPRITLSRDAEGWRVGYALPARGEPSHAPRWAVVAWIAGRWSALDEAAAVALDVQGAALNAGPCDPEALVVVLEDHRPRPVIV